MNETRKKKMPTTNDIWRDDIQMYSMFLSCVCRQSGTKYVTICIIRAVYIRPGQSEKETVIWIVNAVNRGPKHRFSRYFFGALHAGECDERKTFGIFFVRISVPCRDAEGRWKNHRLDGVGRGRARIKNTFFQLLPFEMKASTQIA